MSESAQAIGRGIGSVVSTVEETLGVPSPQELVIEKEEGEANEKLLKKKKEKQMRRQRKKIQVKQCYCLHTCDTTSIIQ